VWAATTPTRFPNATLIFGQNFELFCFRFEIGKANKIAAWPFHSFVHFRFAKMGYGSAPSPLRRALCIVLFFYLSFLLDFTAGLYSFDVFRMIQYDKAGAPFGSQRTSVSLQAVSISADIARKMVVAPYEQVDVTLIEEANAKAGGLLILLPPRDVKLQRGVIEKWMEVEAQLNSRELRIPVYFAVVTPEIQEAMSTITSAGDEGAIVSGFLSSIYSDEYVMVASSADPSPITGVSLTNFQVRPTSLPFESHSPN
jgi:hypothetical protein